MSKEIRTARKVHNILHFLLEPNQFKTKDKKYNENYKENFAI